MTKSQVFHSWPGIPFLTVESRIPFRRGDSYNSELLLQRAGAHTGQVHTHDSHADVHGAEECAAVIQDCALSSPVSPDYPLSQFMAELCSLIICHP